MTTTPLVFQLDHQLLADGLSVHVLRDEMPRRKAQEIITYYQENHPGEDGLDESVLAQVRKDWGLEKPK